VISLIISRFFARRRDFLHEPDRSPRPDAGARWRAPL